MQSRHRHTASFGELANGQFALVRPHNLNDTSGSSATATIDVVVYYGENLALIHHLGFGAHADQCAPGILQLIDPVRQRGGIVLELGCGSGLLTKHLVDAGHRVVATDASPAMLEIARQYAAGAEEFRQLVLPDDPLPEADAIVSIGHCLNYLPDETKIQSALIQIAGALSSGGVVAFDLCDLEFGRVRDREPTYARCEEDWAIMTEFAHPSPRRFVRRITTFVHAGDGAWRRDDELHENVLVDVSQIPATLQSHGLEAHVRPSFANERLPEGLFAVVGNRPG